MLTDAHEPFMQEPLQPGSVETGSLQSSKHNENSRQTNSDSGVKSGNSQLLCNANDENDPDHTVHQVNLDFDYLIFLKRRIRTYLFWLLTYLKK